MICPSMSYKYYDIVSVGIVKSDFILMTLLNITPVLAATAAHMYRAHKKSVVATRNIYSWLYRSSGIEQGHDLAS